VRPDTIKRHNERVLFVLPYIISRLGSTAESLTLDQLAKIANTAPFYFHRIFRDITGEPVHRFIRKLQLDLAAYRLLLSDRCVTDIALEAGYESHAAFTRAFKQSFGDPPVEFRRQFSPLSQGDPAPNGYGCWTLPSPRQRPAACFNVRDPFETGSSIRRKVAFIPHFGPYREVRATWGRLHDYLLARGLRPNSMDAIGIVHDGPEHCLGAHIRYDACVTVPHDFAAGRGIGVQFIPESNCIVASHRGLPDLLVYTYIRLVLQWMTQDGARRFRRLPYYEVYRRFPFVDDPYEIQAEIQVGLE
jgi:AraC family transcriptional regulator